LGPVFDLHFEERMKNRELQRQLNTDAITRARDEQTYQQHYGQNRLDETKDRLANWGREDKQLADTRAYNERGTAAQNAFDLTKLDKEHQNRLGEIAATGKEAYRREELKQQHDLGFYPKLAEWLKVSGHAPNQITPEGRMAMNQLYTADETGKMTFDQMAQAAEASGVNVWSAGDESAPQIDAMTNELVTRGHLQLPAGAKPEDRKAATDSLRRRAEYMHDKGLPIDRFAEADSAINQMDQSSNALQQLDGILSNPANGDGGRVARMGGYIKNQIPGDIIQHAPVINPNSKVIQRFMFDHGGLWEKALDLSQIKDPSALYSVQDLVTMLTAAGAPVTATTPKQIVDVAKELIKMSQQGPEISGRAAATPGRGYGPMSGILGK
jgi:hypothetical protein